MTGPTKPTGVGHQIVEYATEKWGGRPHYRGDAFVLGADEHGTWLWGPAGRTIYRGDEPLFVAELDALTVIPDDEWWSIAWWIGHADLELYVNINTPAVWNAGRVIAIDLDLDVARRLDGAVVELDRDEFEVHQKLYGYPANIVEATEAATARALERTRRNVAPFDGEAAQRWIDVARALPVER